MNVELFSILDFVTFAISLELSFIALSSMDSLSAHLVVNAVPIIGTLRFTSFPFLHVPKTMGPNLRSKQIQGIAY
jgi:hypothetical protein